MTEMWPGDHCSFGYSGHEKGNDDGCGSKSIIDNYGSLSV